MSMHLTLGEVSMFKGLLTCSGCLQLKQEPMGHPTQNSNHVIYVKLFLTLHRPFHGDMHMLMEKINSREAG
jgi:hypothetical protein